jgi:hypothetical protein
MNLNSVSLSRQNLTFLGLLLVVILLLVTTCCTPGDAPADGSGSGADVGSVEPVDAADGTGAAMVVLTFQTLL